MPHNHPLIEHSAFWVMLVLTLGPIALAWHFWQRSAVVAQRTIEAALHNSHEYTLAVLDALGDAVFVDDARTGRIIDVNRRMCEMYGYTRAEALQCDVGALSQGDPPYDQEHALEWLRRAREDGPQTFDWLAKTRQGSVFWAEINIRFVTIGTAERFIVTAREIGARKQAEARLRQYQYMIAAMSDSIALLDREYRYLVVNDEYLRRHGRERAAIEGHSVAELLGAEVFESVIKNRLDRCLAGESVQYQDWFDLPLKGRRFLDVVYSPYLDASGRIDGIVGSTRDITELKRMEDELRRLVNVDPLTGLFNRRHFFTLAAQEVERFRRYRHPLALLMADIDHFKQVNDRHGHLVGDEVLRVIAGELQRNLRQVDILGRYGGEEFVILLPETDLDTAHALAERLRLAIAGLPIAAGDRRFAMTVSLGVAAARDDDRLDLEQLLDRADRMLYQAKQGGRNRVGI